MIKVKKVEVKPSKEKFGIVHILTVADKDTLPLREAFRKYASAEEFEVEDKTIRLNFGSGREFVFNLEKPLEDFYDDEVHQSWKTMVADAMGTEEPFRFYSFVSEKGEHIGTVAYKQDCDTFVPVILVYKDFSI